MKSTIAKFSLALLAATPAFAHIEQGIWIGKTANGETCQMEVFEQTFEQGVRHPLNERIRVKIAGQELKIYHPRAVDSEKGLVMFNHDRFEGVLPNATGSNAVIVEMKHADDFEGPVSFLWIEHNWKTETSKQVDCLGIQLQR